MTDRSGLPPIACEHCGSENVTASLEPVRPHGKRIEKVVTALLEAKQDD